MGRMLHDRKFCSVNFAFKSFASNTALGEFPRKNGRWIEQSHRIASSEGTSHVRIFYRRAIFYIFRVVTSAFVPLDKNKYPFSAKHRTRFEKLSEVYLSDEIHIYFISKFLLDVRQHGVQYVALRTIQENVISQLSVCIN